MISGVRGADPQRGLAEFEARVDLNTKRKNSEIPQKNQYGEANQ